MAKKKERNRKNKIRGRLPEKRIKFRSERFMLAPRLVELFEQFQLIEQGSCFDIELPVEGYRYSGSLSGIHGNTSESLMVLSCSERDDVGDFTVTFQYGLSKEISTTDAKEWEYTRLSIGNQGDSSPIHSDMSELSH